MPTQVVQAQPSTNAFSGFTQFWEDVKVIAGPYWYPTEPGGRAFSDVIRDWVMLALLILLVMALVGVTAFNTFITRDLLDIIEDKNYSSFLQTIPLYAIGLICAALLAGFSKFVRQNIALDWYQWLNNRIVSKYLSNRAYYKINFKSDIDNPDQRLSQEIEPVTRTVLSFSTTLLEKVLEMIIFLSILWSISQFLAYVLIVYTIEVLFLPQRPYIILGTLREQLLYPKTNRQMTDQELEFVLQQVNLQNLLTRVDSFDTELPWENILSLGEQQRLAFARLLVTHPSFTILDEATSALDLKNEGNLYQQLQETKTTFISVGHRESLFNYHQWVLELSQDSGWQLVTVQDYRQQKAKEIVTSPPENAQITIDDVPNNPI